MKILFVSSSMDLAEAAFYEALKASGNQVDVLSLSHLSWLRKDTTAALPNPPKWILSTTLQTSGNQIAGYFNEVVGKANYDVAVAAGLLAGGVIARQIAIPVVPILWRQDLDFSSKRVGFGERFRNLTHASPALFLEGEYEFEKALSKGSQSAHFLHRQFRFAAPSPILQDAVSGEAKIAMVYPHPINEVRVNALRELLKASLNGTNAEVTPVLAAALYQAPDMRKGRAVSDALQETLGEFTHVVITGAPRQGSTLGQYLLESGQGDRLIVEDTIGLAEWAELSQFVGRGRGARLAERVREAISSGASVTAPAANSSDTAEDLIAASLRAIEQVTSARLEEIKALDSAETFNVFFSTTGLEDRTNGARPQRIRNMADAVANGALTIRINSNDTNIKRRSARIRSLLEQGLTPGIFYGENSTTPIYSETVRQELAGLLKEWRARGGKSAWFVRDLHWLDPRNEISDTDERAEELTRNGLAELNAVGAAVNLLYAPDDAAVRGFQDLLEGHETPDIPWAALPPGTCAMNSPEHGVEWASRERPTILYTGGIGAIYSMSNFLEACRTLLEEGYYVDFLVRDSEVDVLHEQIENHGLGEHPNLSVQTESLDVYVPKSELTIGTILLDSDYAKFSFPYKTMSYVELGFPIIAYSDMAIASFIEESEIGVAVERDTQSVIDAVKHIAARDFTAALAAARDRNSWANRVSTVKSALEG